MHAVRNFHVQSLAFLVCHLALHAMRVFCEVPPRSKKVLKGKLKTKTKKLQTKPIWRKSFGCVRWGPRDFRNHIAVYFQQCLVGILLSAQVCLGQRREPIQATCQCEGARQGTIMVCSSGSSGLSAVAFAGLGEPNLLVGRF